MVPFETFFLSWSLHSARTLAACVGIKYTYYVQSTKIAVNLCVYHSL